MMARRRAGLAALTLIAGASPALATGTVECEAAGGGASMMLTVGSLPMLSIVHMEFAVGERIWSTGGSGDTAIVTGQAFRDGERWLIDAADPNLAGVIAEVRLNEAVEGSSMALAGTLKVKDGGAFAVTCIGP